MAKGSRGGTNNSGGSITRTASGQIDFPDGTKVEFDGDLNYGKKDSTLSPTVRKEIETWENKRRKNKVEYAYAVNPDGTPIGPEIKGGRGSVSTPYSYHNTPDATFTHIHPRGRGQEGYLGGTFSLADLRNWASKAGKTGRAVAKEGTYSISKTKKFDAKGFMAMAKKADADFNSDYKSAVKALDAKYHSRTISLAEWMQGSTKAFNTALVKLHETYRQNQSKYGYEYTLEQI